VIFAPYAIAIDGDGDGDGNSFAAWGLACSFLTVKISDFGRAVQCIEDTCGFIMDATG
jgi:hypothetical protein